MPVTVEGELDLANAIETLANFHVPPLPPVSTDAFELVLYENVAYLARDDRRRAAFEELKSTIGTTPEAILAAPMESLERITSKGILKGTSAAKLRACGEIALREFGSNLSEVLSEDSDSAKKALQKFPGIGEPGAEKILLFAADRRFLAPESNGLRVLVRLGLAGEASSYGRTYAQARALNAEPGGDARQLRRAHLLLRAHGQTVCKRTAGLRSLPAQRAVRLRAPLSTGLKIRASV